MYNYRTGKINLLGNYYYSYWHGFTDLHILRISGIQIPRLWRLYLTSNQICYSGQWSNLKLGIGFFYANKKTTASIVLSGVINPSRNNGVNASL